MRTAGQSHEVERQEMLLNISVMITSHTHTHSLAELLRDPLFTLRVGFFHSLHFTQLIYPRWKAKRAASATPVSRVQQSLAAQFCQFIQFALSYTDQSPPASKFGSLLPPCGHDRYCSLGRRLLTQVQQGSDKHDQCC